MIRPSLISTLALFISLSSCVLPDVSGPCRSDADCKGDRICTAGACVEPDTSDPATDGEMSSTGTPSPTGGGTITSTGSGGEASTAVADEDTGPIVDPCEEAGGVLSPFGACLKSCEHDMGVPGNDLFGDCLSLSMVCTPDDYCAPDDYCNAATDCGDGFACTHFSFSSPHCRALCEGNGRCPAGNACQLSTNELWRELPETTVCRTSN